MPMNKGKTIRSTARDIDTIITKEGVGVKFTTNANGEVTIQSHKSNSIRTVEGLLEACNIDTDAYEVANGTVNKWDQMSGDNGLVELFQVKAKLRRKALTNQEVLETFKVAAKHFNELPKLPKIPKASTKGTNENLLVEFAIPDLHLGKLAWNGETGHGNWNVERAIEAWRNAVNDLIQRAPAAGEAWFVLGNDFFNVDNQEETTTSGTPQDEDGRWAQTYLKGLDLVHETIAKLSLKFPKVKIIVMPGNHDFQRTFYLGTAIEEYYRGTYDRMNVAKDDRWVTIDNRPLTRKYLQFGSTGIGFAHGDRLKKSEIAHLFANEARDIWGKVKRCEMHLGHLHQNKSETIGGVIARWIPALCPPDAWHAKSGYTMTERSATAFVYHKELGKIEELTHYPCDSIYA